jgi:hypothetical protein
MNSYINFQDNCSKAGIAAIAIGLLGVCGAIAVQQQGAINRAKINAPVDQKIAELEAHKKYADAASLNNVEASDSLILEGFDSRLGTVPVERLVGIPHHQWTLILDEHRRCIGHVHQGFFYNAADDPSACTAPPNS